MPAAYRPHDIEYGLLLLIENAHRDNDDMRLLLADGEVFGRIIADLSEAARIEKADQRRLLGKIEHASRFRAGPETIPNLGAAAARRHSNEGSLTRLNLAEQPHHRCQPTRPGGNIRVDHATASWQQRGFQGFSDLR